MKEIKQGFVLSLFSLFFVLLFIFVFFTQSSFQWIDLSRAFLSGSLHFLNPPLNLGDTTFWSGHYYWSGGPLPALLLTPFVFVGDVLQLPTNQAPFHFALVLLVFTALWKLASKIGFSKSDASFWSFAFCFASPLIWIAFSPRYGYFPYLFSVLFLILSLLEYSGKKRWWLIGVYSAAAFLTRPTAGLSVLFFVLEAFRLPKEKRHTVIFQLFIFIVFATLLFGGYNFLRFGSPWEQGYSMQLLTNSTLTQTRLHGMISPAHIPANLYNLLFASPLPVWQGDGAYLLQFPYIKANPWGMSFIFISPYLLILFLFSYRDRLSQNLLITIFFILLTSLVYSGIGFVQLGSRYTLDFLPLLFFLLIKKYRESSPRLSSYFKILIILSALLDLFFVLTLYG